MMAALMALPQIGGPAEQRATRPAQQARPLQSGQGSDDRGRVAGDDTRAVPVEGARIARLGDEGMTGDGVLLAAPHDELEATLASSLG
jgi:hypothetical protein